MASDTHGVPAAVWEAYAKHAEPWDTKSFEDFFGRKPPADLTLCGAPYFDGDGAYLEDPAKHLAKPNCFDALLEEADTTQLRQLFSSTFYIGDRLGELLDGDGDDLMAFVPPAPAELCRPAVWSHEQFWVTEPIATDLASYAWTQQVALEFERGGDLDDLAKRLALTLDRADIGKWPFNRVMRGPQGTELWNKAKVLASPAAAPVEAETRLQNWQAYTDWLVRLLTSTFNVNDAPHGQLQMTPEKSLASGNTGKVVPVTLYWLFRCWFLKESSWLPKVLEAADRSPARVLRDAADAVRELEQGRKHLGRVADVHALREEWFEVFTDPRAAQLKAEAQRQERLKREAEAQAKQEADQAAQRAGRLAKADEARARGHLALVSLPGSGRPKEDSDTLYKGPDGRQGLTQRIDTWHEFKPGCVFVQKNRRTTLELMWFDGQLKPFDPPLSSPSFTWQVAADGETVYAIVDKTLYALDLETGKGAALMTLDPEPEDIARTAAGFALGDGKQLVFHRHARGETLATPYLTLPLEYRHTPGTVLGGKVLGVPTASGALFLALHGEEVIPLARCAHPLASVYPHADGDFASAVAAPYDLELRNAQEAWDAAVEGAEPHEVSVIS